MCRETYIICTSAEREWIFGAPRPEYPLSFSGSTNDVRFPTHLSSGSCARESGPGALPANSDFGVAADAAAGRFPADTPLRRIAADGFYFGATARLRRTQLANLFWADRAICWRDDARANRLRAAAVSED